jgi:type VI protein secretion system component VasK
LLHVVFAVQPALALPPPEDQPEEVLRTEVITEARSPVDGKPLTAREYAELQAREEAARENLASVSPEVRRVINLLRLRRTVRTFFPFLVQ